VLLGSAVAISGETVLVGATRVPGSDLYQGAVYIFTRTGSSWSQQSKLIRGNSGDNDFGISVALRGDVAVIGASGYDRAAFGSGAVLVFTRSGSTWTFQQELVQPNGIFDDRFGSAVAISPDGMTILASTPRRLTSSGALSGAAYVFTKPASNWTLQSELVPTVGQSGALFGTGISLTNSAALIGAPNYNGNCGTAYYFTQTGTTWTQKAQLSPKTLVAGDRYGSTLSLTDPATIVGATGRSSGKGIAYTYNEGLDSGSNTGDENCLAVTADASAMSTRDSVILRTGEKREQETDFSVATPIGSLAFTRTYYQNSQQTYQLMGAGWTHNHHIFLSIVPGSPNTVVIRWENGTVLTFSENSPSLYIPAPGVICDLTWNSSTSQYTLTMADKSLATFNITGTLLSRTWSNGETWTYSYTSGKLVEVNDGYGRKIVFRYVSSGLYTGQLYRVGDLTFNDVDPNAPTGRYIEFGYNLNKMLDATSVIIAGTQPLLTTVRDVRGNIWQYGYYGQNSSEYDVRQLNFLNKVQTPSVDMTGDGVPDAPIVVKQVTYVMNGIELAINGNMEIDSGWTSLNAPTINQQTTVQVDSGTYARRVVTSSSGSGIQGNIWSLDTGFTYILTARIFVVSGSIKMQVSGETVFDRITSGTGVWQTLRAKVTPTVANTGKQIQFVSSSGTAEFYIDAVSIIRTDGSVVSVSQQRGNASIASTLLIRSEGLNYTEEITAGRALTYWFDNGVYAGTQDAAGNLNSKLLMERYRPDLQKDANGNVTALEWDAATGKRLNKVTDALGRQTAFTYNTSGTSVDTLNYSLDAEGRKTEYIYGDPVQPRLPTEVKVFDVGGITVLRWQKFVYDAKGRTLSERTVDIANPNDLTKDLSRITRSYYASGNGAGLLQTVTQKEIGGVNDVASTYIYDTVGRVIKTQQINTFGSCDKSFTLYDNAGNVLASVCNYDNAGADPMTVTAAVALFNSVTPEKNKITTHEYDALSRRSKTTTDAGASYAQTTVTVYDALDRVVRTIGNYDAALAPANPYIAAQSAFGHGTENNKNLVSDTAYNERGLVRQLTDVLGNVTLFGYDDADRVVKTVNNAAAVSYNNNYTTGTSPDPDLSDYARNLLADKDIVTENFYDPVGNLVKTIDALDVATFMVYDALNRLVKTVRIAKSSATVTLNPSDTGYNATNDPRSASYDPSTAPDRDHIDTTVYDAMGRVVRTTDTLGSVVLSGYDGMGRQVRTVRNAKTPTYDLVADPDLSAYPIDATSADQDLVTDTVYDLYGRVLYTLDLNGEKAWTAYDGLNRVVKTVANAVGTAIDGSINDPRSTGYVPNSAVDRDHVTRTVYDASNRALYTEDVLGRKTWYVYDSIGRQVKTIQNCTYSGTGTPAPEDVGYIGQHGTDTAKDVISRTRPAKS